MVYFKQMTFLSYFHENHVCDFSSWRLPEIAHELYQSCFSTSSFTHHNYWNVTPEHNHHLPLAMKTSIKMNYLVAVSAQHFDLLMVDIFD